MPIIVCQFDRYMWNKPGTIHTAVGEGNKCEGLRRWWCLIVVYCWTKRVGGLKSHSWSSGHTTSGLLDRRESAESSGRMTGAKSNWLSRARQWTHLQLIQWRKTANEYTSSYSEQWTTLRHKKLQLLRYSASACFLLAALVSIIVTFVPSSVGSSSPNATVIPGQRSARWNSAWTHSIRELIFYIYSIWYPMWLAFSSSVER